MPVTGFAAQQAAGKPLDEDGGEVDGGLGFRLSLPAGTCRARVPGPLTFPKRGQHLDHRRDRPGVAVLAG